MQHSRIDTCIERNWRLSIQTHNIWAMYDRICLLGLDNAKRFS